ncbi:hypothetical protein LTR65_004656 [Meristemomyces frigidus]
MQPDEHKRFCQKNEGGVFAGMLRYIYGLDPQQVALMPGAGFDMKLFAVAGKYEVPGLLEHTTANVKAWMEANLESRVQLKLKHNIYEMRRWSSTFWDDLLEINEEVARTLDFDARVPVPFSVFPSAYKADKQETAEVHIEEQVTVDAGRAGRTPQHEAARTDERYTREDVRITEEDRRRRPQERVRREETHIYEDDRYADRRDTDRRETRDTDRRDTRVEVERQRYREPYSRYTDAQLDVQDRVYDREGQAVYGNTRHTPATQVDFDTRIDVAERDYRQRTAAPFAQEYNRETRGWQDKSTEPRDYPEAGYTEREPVHFAEAGYTEREPVHFDEKVRIAEERTVDGPRERKHRSDMGYYDEDGHYHSFRHGLHRAADRILHGPQQHEQHHHHSDRVEREEEVVVEDREVTMGAPRYTGGGERSSARESRGGPPNTITIPCHHIRIGDLLILQGRPCQVIRITTSAQTGQHRYLGVDLFTKQLHEESSFVSNPSPSVVVQNMLGPVFKQYRVLDIRDDGRVVAMTETGDVKQGLPVLDQSNLLSRLTDSFNNGRGSVRVLVINDEGRELAVDYKIVHGSRL